MRKIIDYKICEHLDEKEMNLLKRKSEIEK